MVILVGMVAGLFIWLFGPGLDGDDETTTTSGTGKYNKAEYDYYYANYNNAADDVYVQNADYNNLDDNYNNGQMQQQQQQSSSSLNVDDMAQSILTFSPTVFFVVLLPPIIYNSGYHIQRDLFFRNLRPICMFAFIGTAICTVAVASILTGVGWAFFPTFAAQTSFLELLTFGALISATDPVSTLAVFSSKKVDPHLFYLVFGESVLNDAVGLVLFDALAHLLENDMHGLTFSAGEEIMQFLFDFGVVFIGSLCLGIVFALMVALLLKFFDFRRTPLLELCIASSLMYFPFTVAEILHLSGIVTVLFAGIASRRYVEPNLSPQTQVNADWVYRLTAHVTETIIFLELGLSVWQLLGDGVFSFGFVMSALVACLIGRAINVYPLTLVFNLTQRCNICSKKQQPKRPEADEDSEEAPTTNFTTLDAPNDELSHSPNDAKHVDDNPVESQGNEDEDQLTPEDDSIIPWKTAHMLWFSGLRGAVSYGLVRTFPATENKATIVVTTMFLVLLTTFVLGGSTEWMLNFLQIPVNIDENEYLDRLQKRKLMPGFMLRFENQKLYKWVTRRAPDEPRDGIIGNRKKDDDNNDDGDDGEVCPYKSGDNLGGGGNATVDSPDNEGFDEIEVTEDDLQHQHSTVINRRGKIFDYGA